MARWWARCMGSAGLARFLLYLAREIEFAPKNWRWWPAAEQV